MHQDIRCKQTESFRFEQDGPAVLRSGKISEFAATEILGTFKRKPQNTFIVLRYCLAAFLLATTAQAKEPHAYKLEGEINGAHDPSIAREGKI